MIETTSPDGKLVARYMNPRPINVSKAQWLRSDARLKLMVELRIAATPAASTSSITTRRTTRCSARTITSGSSEDFQVAFYRLKPGDPEFVS